ncbi:MAG TPA: ribonuclease III [bacterium]
MLRKFTALFSKIFRNGDSKNNLSDKVILQFEKKLNYHFNDKEIINQALKHRSYLSVTNESRLISNERLELLGDSVLGMVVTEYLYKKYQSKEEGDLTAMKSLLVSRKILARVSREIGIGKFILLNDAEEKSGGRDRTSIIADAFEAIIGAMYLDGGLDVVVKFIHQKLLKFCDKILHEEHYRNFKSILLEYSQSKNLGLPQYHVSDEEGPDHEKLFTIEVIINNEVLGIGKGNSKKGAEQISAKSALKKLNVI